MAVKRQIQLLKNPRHLVMITLNHLDAMQDYTNNADNKKSIYLAHEHLINVSRPNPEQNIYRNFCILLPGGEDINKTKHSYKKTKSS